MHRIFADFCRLSLARVNTDASSVHSPLDRNSLRRAVDMDGTREWSSDVVAVAKKRKKNQLISVTISTMTSQTLPY